MQELRDEQVRASVPFNHRQQVIICISQNRQHEITNDAFHTAFRLRQPPMKLFVSKRNVRSDRVEFDSDRLDLSTMIFTGCNHRQVTAPL